MNLHLDYRPEDFDEFLGNENTVKIIQTKIKNNNLNHSILLTGPSGTGKTTLGRIIARSLGAIKEGEEPNTSFNYEEVDSADFRGIDTIRNIRKVMRLSPIGDAKYRIWLMDECFAKGSLVCTKKGYVPIEKISVGDCVYSLAGEDEVVNTFQNKVPLYRIMKLKFNNKKTIYCSNNHEFYTINGWKKAKDLKNSDFVFSFVSDIFNNKGTNLSEKRNENNKTMRVLRKTYRLLSQQARKIQQKILRSELRSKRQIKSPGSEKENIQSKSKRKNIEKTTRIQYHKKRETFNSRKLETNEEKQSDVFVEQYNKNEEHQKNKRDSSYLVGGKRGKRKNNKTSKNSCSFFGMGNGSCCGSWKTKKGISHKLQIRYWKQRFKDWNRSRWSRTSYEKSYKRRYKKNKKAEFIRLENTEIYESGNNEQSFESIIGSEERNKGYVIFYDLEIKKHPSYFIDDISVHNCHQLSGDAQEALLKALEDTPSHVFIILATTDPSKLKDTLKRRCLTFDLNPIDEDEAFQYLKDVIELESKKVPNPALEKIIEYSMGSMGKALMMLDKIIDLDEEEMEDDIESISRKLNQAIDLCQSIIKKEKWNKIAKILKDLKKENHESIRRMVLKYCSTILLKADNPRAYLIMDAFRNPFYDSPYEKLILACYDSLYAK